MNKVSGINDIHHVPDILDVNNPHDLSANPNEHNARDLHGVNADALEQHQLPAEVTRLFMQLSSQDIEQFYQSYQRWMLEQQIEIQQSQIAALQQKIAQNAALMEQVRPSAIALSALAQLQASGVEDIALLDQMLERGEAWLDRTLQQLAYCERLDLIGDSYTEWCRHALEGAYDWIESMQEAETTKISTAAGEESGPSEAAEVTEDLLLQKLMSDDDTGKMRAPRPRITAPLPALDETSSEPGDITASIATPPAAEIAEPAAEIAPAIEPAEPATEITDVVETAETAEAITAESAEAAASSVETVLETTTEVEPVEATAFENAPANTLETEQEGAEPVAQATPEGLEVIDPAISQAATDREIDEPEQEEQPEKVAAPDAPETTEDDTASADDEVAIDLALANEMEEDETLSEHAAIATEVVTPVEDAASATIDTEDILTTVEQEEEQEAEAPEAASDSELVKDEGITFSAVAEPPPQEEISPPSVETKTGPGSVEAGQALQEQPPAPQPDKKPGFFRRLLAFLLS